MKKIVFFILLLSPLNQGFSQNINFETSEKMEVKTTIKGSYSKLALYEDKYIIAVSTEEITVYDIYTGKKKTSLTFPGSDDKIWISEDGKYAAGTSQQYSPEGKEQINVDGFHYYNFATGKMDSYSITDERLVSDIDFSKKTTNLLMVYTSAVPNSEKTNHALSIYNPITREEKVIYNQITTGSFNKAPISAQYSKDESKIFLYTNEGINCRFNVFDGTTGKPMYSELIKHASAYYETDDYLLMAGADAAGNGITTKHDKTTYKQLAKWVGKEIIGVTPDGKYGILIDFTNKKIQKLDLSNGNVLDWSPLDPQKLNYNAMVFNKDGSQVFIALTNKYSKTPDPNKVGLYCYGVEPVTTVGETVKPTNDQPEPIVESWVKFSNTLGKFEGLMVDKAKETVTESKGKKTIQLIADNKVIAHTLVASELSSKIKKSKYESLSEKLSESFIKKGYEVVEKNSYSYKDQKGSRYLLKKGDLFYHYINVCYNGFAYQLMQISKEKKAEDAKKFIDSFVISE